MKHVEEPRLRDVTHFGVQAWALARGAPQVNSHEAIIKKLTRSDFRFQISPAYRRQGFQIE